MRTKINAENKAFGMSGGKSSESVFPMGAKVKTMAGVEGAGGMEDYPDKEEDIRRVQEKGVAALKRNRPKTDYRN